MIANVHPGGTPVASPADDPSLPNHPVSIRYDQLIAEARRASQAARDAASAQETEALMRRWKLMLLRANHLADECVRMMRAAPDELPSA